MLQPTRTWVGVRGSAPAGGGHASGAPTPGHGVHPGLATRPGIVEGTTGGSVKGPRWHGRPICSVVESAIICHPKRPVSLKISPQIRIQIPLPTPPTPPTTPPTSKGGGDFVQYMPQQGPSSLWSHPHPRVKHYRSCPTWGANSGPLAQESCRVLLSHGGGGGLMSLETPTHPEWWMTQNPQLKTPRAGGHPCTHPKANKTQNKNCIAFGMAPRRG